MYKSGLYCPRCGNKLKFLICGSNEASLLRCQHMHHFWAITKRCNHSDLLEAEEYNHTTTPELVFWR